MEKINEILVDSPIIAAVKDDAGLQRALDSDCQVVFLLYGTILSVENTVQRIHERNKICIVHIDLIEGFNNRDIAVDALVKISRPDGIISTRASLIRRAKQLGLITIQRVFLLDSLSLNSLLSQVDSSYPDYIEVLPGVIPGVIKEITETISIPLIAGGLIRNKQDVIQALQSGVLAVSTTCQSVWKM